MNFEDFEEIDFEEIDYREQVLREESALMSEENMVKTVFIKAGNHFILKM